jgi:hypothetical protein
MKLIRSLQFAISFASILLASSADAAARVRTGAFTLTAGQAVRAHIVNTSAERLFVGARIIGMNGDSEEDFPHHSVDSEEIDSFYSEPGLAGRTSATIRMEFIVEDATTDRKLSFIATVEVVDAATGQTRYLVQVLPPLDDDKSG